MTERYRNRNRFPERRTTISSSPMFSSSSDRYAAAPKNINIFNLKYPNTNLSFIVVYLLNIVVIHLLHPHLLGSIFNTLIFVPKSYIRSISRITWPFGLHVLIMFVQVEGRIIFTFVYFLVEPCLTACSIIIRFKQYLEFSSVEL